MAVAIDGPDLIFSFYRQANMSDNQTRERPALVKTDDIAHRALSSY